MVFAARSRKASILASRDSPASSRPAITSSASTARPASATPNQPEQHETREQVLDQFGDGKADAERDEAAGRPEEYLAPGETALRPARFARAPAIALRWAAGSRRDRSARSGRHWDRRERRRRACAGGSSQAVSDQEFERAIETDMRQRRDAGFGAFEQRRAEAQETIIGFLGRTCIQTAEAAFARRKDRLRILGRSPG